MSKLIHLELKRNHLKSYNIAVLIITIIMLGLIYFFAAIPKIDPNESDLELFTSYTFLIGFNHIISMAIFSILSAVLASKFIVEEYASKKAILLFSYPTSRRKILDVKMFVVFAYTVCCMVISNVAILIVFLITESIVTLCPDRVTISMIIKSILLLLCYSMMSGFLGIISLWIGFYKRSIVATIIAACIMVVLMCQIMAISISFTPILIGIFAVVCIIALLGRRSLCLQIEKMEV